MVDLKTWLSQQDLSVRELAFQLEVPLKTAEDRIYRGVVPSPENRERIVEFIKTECTHHWVIESANGPLSEGVCQRCGERREFANSAATSMWLTTHRPTA